MFPLPLQHTSARVLEFDAFREVLAGYVGSPLGKARVSQLTPTADREWIARQQQLEEEVRQYWVAGGRFDFSGLFDARELLAKSRLAGAGLEIIELRDILPVVAKAAEWPDSSPNHPVKVKIAMDGSCQLGRGA